MGIWSATLLTLLVYLLNTAAWPQGLGSRYSSNSSGPKTEMETAVVEIPIWNCLLSIHYVLRLHIHSSLSVYNENTACYSNRKPSYIPWVPCLSPTPFSNLGCFGPIQLPLMSIAGLSRTSRVVSVFRSPPVQILRCEIRPRISSSDGKSSYASLLRLVESLLRPAIPTAD